MDYIFTWVASGIWLLVIVMLVIALTVDSAAFNGVLGASIAAVPFTIIAYTEIRDGIRRG